MSYFKYYLEKIDSPSEESLADKAKKSGISLSILQKVFNRGVGAFNTNPGSVRPWVKAKGPEAGRKIWAHARVNSFIRGGKTRTTADADLWQKHLKNKKK